MFPINWRLANPEIEYLINHSNPNVIFFDTKFEDKISQIHIPRSIKTIAVDNSEINQKSLEARRLSCNGRIKKTIKNNLPLAKVSGGLSNVSFSFRGNNQVREAMHSCFLYHAIKYGLDMAIVNAGQITIYEQIPKALKECIEDVLFNRHPDATENLIEISKKYSGSIERKKIFAV